MSARLCLAFQSGRGICRREINHWLKTHVSAIIARLPLLLACSVTPDAVSAGRCPSSSLTPPSSLKDADFTSPLLLLAQIWVSVAPKSPICSTRDPHHSKTTGITWTALVMSSESETEPPAQGKDPWVRYRVEYRDNTTGELFSELYAQNQKESLEQEESRDHHHVVMDEPIFELMTVYQARRSAGSTLGESSVSFLTMSHTTHLTIYSPAIINALQSVVKYYPSQDLTGNPLTINYPYAVLAHHYDELDAFREACATKAPDEMCAREEHASEHLALLIKFLDDSVMTDVRLEMERNKEGIMTWEHSWVG